jgi:DNA-binding transcriptional ArsR family regulator
MGKSNKRGKEGQYAPLTYGFLRSDAWRDLTGSAVKVFLELHTRFNGSNNGKLTLSYAEAAEALGLGKATVKRAFSDLTDKGFVVLEREGNWYHRRAHEWRITTKPVQRPKGKELASNDWHRYRRAKTKHGSDLNQQGGAVVPFQNRSGVLGSKIEPVRAKNTRSLGSKSEH